MYLDRAVLPIEVKAQYRLVTPTSRW